DLRSFTRAAQSVGKTQSAISLQLKRLETRLSARLVERTLRSVKLTAAGAAFLERARDLLAAHDRALAGAKVPAYRLTIGISDHVAGPDLAALPSRGNAVDPKSHLDGRVDLSGTLFDAFQKGKFDAVIVRRERHRRGGEALFEKKFGSVRTAR